MSAYIKEDILLELNRAFCATVLPDNTRMGSGSYTNELYPYNALFSPAEFAGLKLKNRVIASVHDRALQKEHINGETALICIPAEHIREFDEMSRIRNLISEAHKAGAYVFAEYAVVENSGRTSLSAKKAAKNDVRFFAEDVLFHGFDGIMLREICGSCLDALMLIRSIVGSSLPVICDIKVSTALYECYGEQMKKIKAMKPFKSQKSIADSLDYLEKLVSAGADMFCVGIGSVHNAWLLNPASAMPAGCYLDISKYIKEYFAATELRSGRGLPVTVVASGRLAYPDIAEDALRRGMCDLVMLDDTPELDPAWCKKAMSGNADKIVPLAPYAAELRSKPEKTDSPKRIAVVGGGENGMRFALGAAKRGHSVTLYEAGTELGGMLRAHCGAVNAYELNNYLRTLIELCENVENLTVRCGCRANGAMLKAGRYDAIVCADGMSQSMPSMPGWGEKAFISAYDIMLHPESCPDVRGKKVVITGANRLGCECALLLKAEKQCRKLTILESSEFVCGDGTHVDLFTVYRLTKAGVHIHTMAAPKYMKDGGIYYEELLYKDKPDPCCTWLDISEDRDSEKTSTVIGFAQCDIVVAADGWSANELCMKEAESCDAAPVIRRVDTLEQALELAKTI